MMYDIKPVGTVPKLLAITAFPNYFLIKPRLVFMQRNKNNGFIAKVTISQKSLLNKKLIWERRIARNSISKRNKSVDDEYCLHCYIIFLF